MTPLQQWFFLHHDIDVPSPEEARDLFGSEIAFTLSARWIPLKEAAPHTRTLSEEQQEEVLKQFADYERELFTAFQYLVDEEKLYLAQTGRDLQEDYDLSYIVEKMEGITETYEKFNR